MISEPSIVYWHAANIAIYLKLKISSWDKTNGLYADKTWIIFQINREKRQIAECVGVVINNCHVDL